MQGLRRINDAVHSMDITGYVFAFREGGPVLASMPGTPDLFILIFSTTEKLHQTMGDYALPYDQIKRIDRPREFMESVQAIVPGTRIRIAADANKMDAVVRFREIIL
jgi:hypothetical protein